jgi:hypothetical protein
LFGMQPFEATIAAGKRNIFQSKGCHLSCTHSMILIFFTIPHYCSCITCM